MILADQKSATSEAGVLPREAMGFLWWFELLNFFV